MRAFLLAAPVLASLLAVPAFAASDVLLPPSDAPAPNMGLAPPSAAPAPLAAPAPAAPSATMDAAPMAETHPYTPVPQPSLPAPILTNNGLVRPTTVIQMPAMPALPQMPAGAGVPKPAHALEVELGNKSVWGSDDISTVSDRLGIAAKDVPTHCHMSLQALVVTDKTPTMVDLTSSLSGSAGYDGTLRTVRATVRALCDATAPLPANKGFIMQMGDKYVVQLGIALCTAPESPAPQKLTITYAGDSNANCAFQ